MTLFFGADYHLDHERILIYQEETRPYATVQAMNDAYIAQWNSQVQGNDTVCYLGDFCWGNFDNVRRFARNLNGKIILIPGNHDRWVKPYRNKNLAETQPIVSASGHIWKIRSPLVTIRERLQKIVLCHYPLRSWDSSFHGSWHLHGHVHKHLNPWGMSMDVGVDGSGGMLYSFEDVQKYMEKRKIELAELALQKEAQQP